MSNQPSENPFAAPEANLDAHASKGRVDPERAREIAAMIKKLNNKSLLIGGFGLLLQVYGQMQNAPIAVLVGTVMLIAGLVYYAKMKGRNPLWAGLGLLSCLGLLFLLVLSSYCHNCGEQVKRGSKTCDTCGAPAPA